MGQLPPQPLSLSSPQILQHPKEQQRQLVPSPPLAPLPCSPSLQQEAGLAACAHTPFPRWVLMLM